MYLFFIKQAQKDQELSQNDQEMYQKILSTITDKSKRIAIEIIYKDPTTRKKQEVQSLIDSTASFPFFDGYIQAGQAEIHAQCCKKMKLEVQAKNQVVFQVGEHGQKFYLILHGSVSVQIKMPGQQDDLPVKQQNIGSDTNIENIINQIGTEVKKNRIRNITSNSRQIDNAQNLLQVQILKEGSQFGEMALLNNQKRLAKIKCLENCIFAILGKKDFKEILKKNEEDKLYKELCYFSSLPYFVSWNMNMLKNLFLNSRKREFIKDQYIFQEGDPADSVYIIKKGDFMQSKRFSRLNDIDGLNLDEDDIKVFDENEYLNKFEPQKKDMQICILNENTMIGEEDLIRNNDKSIYLTKRTMCGKRTFSVKCTSLQGSAIRIDQYEFLYRIMLEESSKICILKWLQIKDQSFNKRAFDIQSNLSQYQNYFYQNSKHKEYIRSKIESQSSKLFQNNSQKNGILKNNQLNNSPLNNKQKQSSSQLQSSKDLNTKIQQPSVQSNPIYETLKSVLVNKRIQRSFSSTNAFKSNQMYQFYDQVDDSKKVSTNKLKQNNSQNQSVQSQQEQITNSFVQFRAPQSDSNLDKPQTRPKTSSNQIVEKRVRSISSNDLNLYQIIKMSLQDKQYRFNTNETSEQNNTSQTERKTSQEQPKRAKLLQGNIEQSIKVNFKKAFLKKLKDKGTYSDIKEIPTWNKISMSFANQILVYNCDTWSKSRDSSSQKPKDIQTRKPSKDEKKSDLISFLCEDEQEQPIKQENDQKPEQKQQLFENQQINQYIIEQQVKRKEIRSSSNPKKLIKVMRNFESSQLNQCLSKLVEYKNEDEDENKSESYLRSLDYNSLSKLNRSPIKNNSSVYKTTLKLKKK